MFRTFPFSIIRSFSLYQWYMSHRFADSLIASCQQTGMTYTIGTVKKTPDDGQRNCPKHVEIYSKIKISETSAPSWFYYKNLSRSTVN